MSKQKTDAIYIKLNDTTKNASVYQTNTTTTEIKSSNDTVTVLSNDLVSIYGNAIQNIINIYNDTSSNILVDKDDIINIQGSQKDFNISDLTLQSADSAGSNVLTLKNINSNTEVVLRGIQDGLKINFKEKSYIVKTIDSTFKLVPQNQFDFTTTEIANITKEQLASINSLITKVVIHGTSDELKAFAKTVDSKTKEAKFGSTEVKKFEVELAEDSNAVTIDLPTLLKFNDAGFKFVDSTQLKLDVTSGTFTLNSILTALQNVQNVASIELNATSIELSEADYNLLGKAKFADSVAITVKVDSTNQNWATGLDKAKIGGSSIVLNTANNAPITLTEKQALQVKDGTSFKDNVAITVNLDADTSFSVDNITQIAKLGGSSKTVKVLDTNDPYVSLDIKEFKALSDNKIKLNTDHQVELLVESYTDITVPSDYHPSKLGTTASVLINNNTYNYIGINAEQLQTLFDNNISFVPKGEYLNIELLSNAPISLTQNEFDANEDVLNLFSVLNSKVNNTDTVKPLGKLYTSIKTTDKAKKQLADNSVALVEDSNNSIDANGVKALFGTTFKAVASNHYVVVTGNDTNAQVWAVSTDSLKEATVSKLATLQGTDLSKLSIYNFERFDTKNPNNQLVDKFNDVVYINGKYVKVADGLKDYTSENVDVILKDTADNIKSIIDLNANDLKIQGLKAIQVLNTDKTHTINLNKAEVIALQASGVPFERNVAIDVKDSEQALKDLIANPNFNVFNFGGELITLSADQNPAINFNYSNTDEKALLDHLVADRNLKIAGDTTVLINNLPIDKNPDLSMLSTIKLGGSDIALNVPTANLTFKQAQFVADQEDLHFKDGNTLNILISDQDATPNGLSNEIDKAIVDFTTENLGKDTQITFDLAEPAILTQGQIEALNGRVFSPVSQITVKFNDLPVVLNVISQNLGTQNITLDSETNHIELTTKELADVALSKVKFADNDVLTIKIDQTEDVAFLADLSQNVGGLLQQFGNIQGIELDLTPSAFELKDDVYNVIKGTKVKFANTVDLTTSVNNQELGTVLGSTDGAKSFKELGGHSITLASSDDVTLTEPQFGNLAGRKFAVNKLDNSPLTITVENATVTNESLDGLLHDAYSVAKLGGSKVVIDYTGTQPASLMINEANADAIMESNGRFAFADNDALVIKFNDLTKALGYTSQALGAGDITLDAETNHIELTTKELSIVGENKVKFANDDVLTIKIDQTEDTTFLANLAQNLGSILDQFTNIQSIELALVNPSTLTLANGDYNLLKSTQGKVKFANTVDLTVKVNNQELADKILVKDSIVKSQAELGGHSITLASNDDVTLTETQFGNLAGRKFAVNKLDANTTPLTITVQNVPVTNESLKGLLDMALSEQSLGGTNVIIDLANPLTINKANADFLTSVDNTRFDFASDDEITVKLDPQDVAEVLDINSTYKKANFGLDNVDGTLKFDFANDNIVLDFDSLMKLTGNKILLANTNNVTLQLPAEQAVSAFILNLNSYNFGEAKSLTLDLINSNSNTITLNNQQINTLKTYAEQKSINVKFAHDDKLIIDADSDAPSSINFGAIGDLGGDNTLAIGNDTDDQHNDIFGIDLTGSKKSIVELRGYGQDSLFINADIKQDTVFKFSSTVDHVTFKAFNPEAHTFDIGQVLSDSPLGLVYTDVNATDTDENVLTNNSVIFVDGIVDGQTVTVESLFGQFKPFKLEDGKSYVVVSSDGANTNIHAVATVNQQITPKLLATIEGETNIHQLSINNFVAGNDKFDDIVHLNALEVSVAEAIADDDHNYQNHAGTVIIKATPNDFDQLFENSSLGLTLNPKALGADLIQIDPNCAPSIHLTADQAFALNNAKLPFDRNVEIIVETQQPSPQFTTYALGGDVVYLQAPADNNNVRTFEFDLFNQGDFINALQMDRNLKVASDTDIVLKNIQIYADPTNVYSTDLNQYDSPVLGGHLITIDNSAIQNGAVQLTEQQADVIASSPALSFAQGNNITVLMQNTNSSTVAHAIDAYTADKLGGQLIRLDLDSIDPVVLSQDQVDALNGRKFAQDDNLIIKFNDLTKALAYNIDLLGTTDITLDAESNQVEITTYQRVNDVKANNLRFDSSDHIVIKGDDQAGLITLDNMYLGASSITLDDTNDLVTINATNALERGNAKFDSSDNLTFDVTAMQNAIKIANYGGSSSIKINGRAPEPDYNIYLNKSNVNHIQIDTNNVKLFSDPNTAETFVVGDPSATFKVDGFNPSQDQIDVTSLFQNGLNKLYKYFDVPLTPPANPTALASDSIVLFKGYLSSNTIQALFNPNQPAFIVENSAVGHYIFIGNNANNGLEAWNVEVSSTDAIVTPLVQFSTMTDIEQLTLHNFITMQLDMNDNLKPTPASQIIDVNAVYVTVDQALSGAYANDSRTVIVRDTADEINTAFNNNDLSATFANSVDKIDVMNQDQTHNIKLSYDQAFAIKQAGIKFEANNIIKIDDIDTSLDKVFNTLDHLDISVNNIGGDYIELANTMNNNVVTLSLENLDKIVGDRNIKVANDQVVNVLKDVASNTGLATDDIYGDSNANPAIDPLDFGKYSLATVGGNEIKFIAGSDLTLTYDQAKVLADNTALVFDGYHKATILITNDQVPNSIINFKGSELGFNGVTLDVVAENNPNVNVTLNADLAKTAIENGIKFASDDAITVNLAQANISDENLIEQTTAFTPANLGGSSVTLDMLDNQATLTADQVASVGVDEGNDPAYKFANDDNIIVSNTADDFIDLSQTNFDTLGATGLGGAHVTFDAKKMSNPASDHAKVIVNQSVVAGISGDQNGRYVISSTDSLQLVGNNTPYTVNPDSLGGNQNIYIGQANDAEPVTVTLEGGGATLIPNYIGVDVEATSLSMTINDLLNSNQQAGIVIYSFQPYTDLLLNFGMLGIEFDGVLKFYANNDFIAEFPVTKNMSIDDLLMSIDNDPTLIVLPHGMSSFVIGNTNQQLGNVLIPKFYISQGNPNADPTFPTLATNIYLTTDKAHNITLNNVKDETVKFLANATQNVTLTNFEVSTDNDGNGRADSTLDGIDKLDFTEFFRSQANQNGEINGKFYKPYSSTEATVATLANNSIILLNDNTNGGLDSTKVEALFTGTGVFSSTTSGKFVIVSGTGTGNAKVWTVEIANSTTTVAQIGTLTGLGDVSKLTTENFANFTGTIQINPVYVTVANALGADSAHAPYASGYKVILQDTEANLQGLDANEIAYLKAIIHVDGIDSTDNTINLTVAQMKAWGNDGLDMNGDDIVKIYDMGYEIKTLTSTTADHIENWATYTNVDSVGSFSTGDDYALTTTQLTAIGNAKLTAPNDTITASVSLDADFTNAKLETFYTVFTNVDKYNITGSATDDTITAPPMPDVAEGNNTINGGNGTADELIVKDTIDLSSPTNTYFANVTNVEKITLQHTTTNVKIATADTLVGNGATLKVDGHALTTGLSFDGHLETNGKFEIIGGGAVDSLVGGAGDDTFVYFSDTDLFADATVDGGAGTNVILLDASGEDDITISATGNWANIKDIDVIKVTATSNAYSLTLDATAETTTGITKIDLSGDTTTGGENIVNISEYTNSATVIGSAGNDNITGGTGADSLSGGAGDDAFIYTVGSEIFNDATIDGGDAKIGDVIVLDSSAGALTIANTGSWSKVTGVEKLVIAKSANAYTLAFNANYAISLIDASTDTTTGGTNTIDLSAVTTLAGGFGVTGSAGNDSIVGSKVTGDQNGDSIVGGSGDDIIVANAGDYDTLDGGFNDDANSDGVDDNFDALILMNGANLTHAKISNFEIVVVEEVVEGSSVTVVGADFDSTKVPLRIAGGSSTVGSESTIHITGSVDIRLSEGSTYAGIIALDNTNDTIDVSESTNEITITGGGGNDTFKLSQRNIDNSIKDNLTISDFTLGTDANGNGLDDTSGSPAVGTIGLDKLDVSSLLGGNPTTFYRAFDSDAGARTLALDNKSIVVVNDKVVGGMADTDVEALFTSGVFSATTADGNFIIVSGDGTHDMKVWHVNIASSTVTATQVATLTDDTDIYSVVAENFADTSWDASKVKIQKVYQTVANVLGANATVGGGDDHVAYNTALTVVLKDSKAHIEALTKADIDQIKALNVDGLNVIGDTVDLTVEKAKAFGSSMLDFDYGDTESENAQAHNYEDTINIVDTAANISTELAVTENSVVTGGILTATVTLDANANPPTTRPVIETINAIDSANPIFVPATIYNATLEAKLDTNNLIVLKGTGAEVDALTLSDFTKIDNYYLTDTNPELSIANASVIVKNGADLRVGSNGTTPYATADLSIKDTNANIGSLITTFNDIDKTALKLKVADYNITEANHYLTINASAITTIAGTPADLTSFNAELAKVGAIKDTSDKVVVTGSSAEVLPIILNNTNTYGSTHANIDYYDIGGVGIAGTLDLNFNDVTVGSAVANNGSFANLNTELAKVDIGTGATADKVSITDTNANIVTLLTDATYNNALFANVDSYTVTGQTALELTVAQAKLTNVNAELTKVTNDVHVKDAGGLIVNDLTALNALTNIDKYDASDDIMALTIAQAVSAGTRLTLDDVITINAESSYVGGSTLTGLNTGDKLNLDALTFSDWKTSNFTNNILIQNQVNGTVDAISEWAFNAGTGILTFYATEENNAGDIVPLNNGALTITLTGITSVSATAGSQVLSLTGGNIG